MADEYDLQRFVTAQRDIYDAALRMVRSGEMCSQWMSIVYPRFAGCYHDQVSEAFAISSLDEARAYLAHPLLGGRLRESFEALNWLSERSPEELMNEQDMKNLHSSLTLFAEASWEPHLRTMLSIWFGCRAEELTISQLDLSAS